jgi:hypothetical protein
LPVSFGCRYTGGDFDLAADAEALGDSGQGATPDGVQRRQASGEFGAQFPLLNYGHGHIVTTSNE